MKTGVFLLGQNTPEDDGQAIQDTLEDVRAAERMGMDAAFLAEHHFDNTCAYVDPLTFAGALATATTRIKIGFAVLQTSLYQPLRMAEQIALLDNLSGGRLIVGLGRGSLVNTHEYSGFQIDASTAQERLEEIEEILIKCWSGQPVVHAGKYWNFEIPMLRPRVRTLPHPPLLRSVSSDGSLAAQARRKMPIMVPPGAPPAAADTGASPLGPVATLKRRLQFYRDSMREAGHSPEDIAKAVGDSWALLSVIVADSDAEARDVGLPYQLEAQAYRQQLSAGANAVFGSKPTNIIHGSVSTVRDQLLALDENEVGGLILRFRMGYMPSDMVTNGMALFMREVMPALNERRIPEPA